MEIGWRWPAENSIYIKNGASALVNSRGPPHIILGIQANKLPRWLVLTFTSVLEHTDHFAALSTNISVLQLTNRWLVTDALFLELTNHFAGLSQMLQLYTSQTTMQVCHRASVVHLTNHFADRRCFSTVAQLTKSLRRPLSKILHWTIYKLLRQPVCFDQTKQRHALRAWPMLKWLVSFWLICDF